ncbi:MAG: transglycosylase SLT domain-containing protein [Pseudomonadota bacterium]
MSFRQFSNAVLRRFPRLSDKCYWDRFSIRKPRSIALCGILLFVVVVGAYLYRELRLNIPRLESINAADRLSFYSHWETRFPQYRNLFIEASGEHDLEWPLLSAVGYQESKWVADAVSPTGVRGLMMLTQATANELGVRDRTEPAESINGGARYLKYLTLRAPKDLDQDGRRWFAVSAYNGGIGRLTTAYRQWVAIQGSEPDWYAFEKDMLGAAENSALQVSMKYTRRVRDFYKIAGSLAEAEEN